ncbi:MAG TPA: hypothetical protein VJA21_19410 [Verrucomicrobiae bacterium]
MNTEPQRRLLRAIFGPLAGKPDYEHDDQVHVHRDTRAAKPPVRSCGPLRTPDGFETGLGRAIRLGEADPTSLETAARGDRYTEAIRNYIPKHVD